MTRPRCWMAACRNGCGRAAQTEDGEAAATDAGDFRADFRAGQLRGVGDMLRNVLTRCGTGAGCARGRPLHRRGAGATGRHAQRPHPGFGQPAIYRSAACRRHIPPGRRGARSGSRPPGSMGRGRSVTSCGSGVTACILTLGLRVAGLPEGAVYDGSWTEWGGRSDTPVEVG